MTNTKSLLITLTEPVKMFVSNTRLESSNLVLENDVLSPPSFPLWAVCPDILINSIKREFVGVCYFVGEDEKEVVESLSTDLSNQVVRYVNSPLSDDATPYIKNNMEPNHLQIKWSSTDADDLEIAQLDSDYWYYSQISENESRFRAFGLDYIDKILLDHKLNFPVDIEFSLFQPKFI